MHIQLADYGEMLGELYGDVCYASIGEPNLNQLYKTFLCVRIKPSYVLH